MLGKRLSKAVMGPRTDQPSSPAQLPTPAGRHPILSLLVLAVPVICTLFLVRVYLDESLTAFIPQRSDRIFHWHQTATFAAAGFNGGYYTVNEQPAAFSLVRFYAHGPVYPILYGSIGRLVGWKLNTAPLLNLAFLSFALAVFIAYVKPTRWQLLLTGLVILTCWPIHLYLVTNMRLALFASLAIILAGSFYKALSQPETVSPLHLAFLFLTIVLTVLLKLSNSVLFIPYLIAIRGRIGLSFLRAMVVAVLLAALSVLLTSQIVADYPLSFVNDLLREFSRSFGEGLGAIGLHAASNLGKFVTLTDPAPWVALRAQLLLITMAACWYLWREHRDGLVVAEGVLILSSIVVTVIAAICLYEIGVTRDYRLFAPVGLMVTLFLVARQRSFLVILIVVVNLLVTPQFLETYRGMMRGSFPGNEMAMAIDAFAKKIAPVVRFEDERDGWGNTLLVRGERLNNRQLLGVPPGIGISWFTSPASFSRVKSRYLLLDDDGYALLKDRVPLEFKLRTAMGGLYVNQRSD